MNAEREEVLRTINFNLERKVRACLRPSVRRV